MAAYFPDWLRFDLWFFVTIAVPVVLPSLGAACLKIAPSSSAKIMSTVSDGQLGWVVVAIGASGVYEALEQMSKAPGLDGGTVLGAIGLMFVGTVIAVAGSVSPTPLLQSQGTVTIGQWISHYRLFTGSMILTLLATLNFMALHHKVQQLHEATQHNSCQHGAAAPQLPYFLQLPKC